MSTYPIHPITAASFQIIDTQLQSLAENSPEWRIPYTAAEYALVRRAIHSSGDFELYQRCRFSPGAVEIGIQALRQGIPVIVDVHMVAVGVEKHLRRLGVPLLCGILAAAPLPADPQQTRTSQGIRHLLQQTPQAIVVIGNAPTALEAVLDMIAHQRANPALVIGVPVGFVGVLAAKQRLAETAVHHIRVEGSKGGSGVAAGMLNALVELALEEKSL